MSNSFYGGKQGFGFILKGNEDADDHFFHNEEEILAAVANKKLRYGEYALISFPDESNVDKIGNLYRVVHGNIELVANISGPAGATGAQGIQGPPGEKGEKGDDGAGFIYMEHEANMYVPTSTTVRFNEIEAGRNIRVTNNITVGFDGDDDEYGNAVHFFGSTGIYSFMTDFFHGQAITQAVDLWNYSLDTYYYDISKLYTLPDGPILDIYEGGRLPPLIYFRGIEVHEGTGAEPMPEGLYMIIRYNNSLAMWPVLWGPDTNSWSNAITINTTDATKKIIKLKMVKGVQSDVSGEPPIMIFLGYVDNTNVKFCAGVASRVGDSTSTTVNDQGTHFYQDGSLKPRDRQTLPHYLFAADSYASSWDCMRAFANWMGGGASLVIQLDGENTTVTYG